MDRQTGTEILFLYYRLQKNVSNKKNVFTDRIKRQTKKLLFFIYILHKE